MYKLLAFAAFLAYAYAAPGVPIVAAPISHSSVVQTHSVVAHPAPVVKVAPVVAVHHAPVVPVVKTHVVTPVVKTHVVAPVVRTTHVVHAPVVHHAPVVPVVKTLHTPVLVH